MADLEMQGDGDLERLLRDALAVTPDPAVRAASKARILAAPLPAGAPRRALRRRSLVAPLAAAFIVLSATGAMAVPVSAHALPGDVLYGVRMATEAIRIGLAGDEVGVRLSIARARTVDLERAVAKGRDDAIEEIARRFFEQIRAIGDLPTGRDGRDARIAALIAAQQSHLDAIADRIEGKIGDPARAADVLRKIRRHDDRPGRGGGHGSGKPDDRDDRKGGRGNSDDADRGKGNRDDDGRSSGDGEPGSGKATEGRRDEERERNRRRAGAGRDDRVDGN